MTPPKLKAKRRVQRRQFLRRNAMIFDILAAEAERQGLDYVPLSGHGYAKTDDVGNVIEERIVFNKEKP